MTSSKGKRLPQEGRREVILKAAAEVFFKKGYAAASIDEIIKRAGGSKRSIYAEFGSKEGLFVAIVTENAKKIKQVLSRAEGEDLRKVLLDTARAALDIVMSPHVIGLNRTCLGDTWRFPRLARIFYGAGVGHVHAQLTKILEAAKKRGEVDLADCDLAANHFIGMVRDGYHLQITLGLRPPPKPAEREVIATAIVDLFLNGALRR